MFGGRDEGGGGKGCELVGSWGREGQGRDTPEDGKADINKEIGAAAGDEEDAERGNCVDRRG